MKSDQIKQLSKEQLLEIINLVNEKKSEWLGEIVIDILLKTSMYPLKYDVRFHDVIRYLIDAEVILAIKTLRIVTGLGLAEAKFTVDAFRQKLYILGHIDHQSQIPIDETHPHVHQKTYNILLDLHSDMRNGKIQRKHHESVCNCWSKTDRISS